jgi:hypothetical protein
MKLRLVLLIAAALSTASLRAEDRPALPLEKAVAIAADYLKSIGKDKDHWIASISYDRESLTNATYKWYVKWGPAMDIGGRKELGLEISMNGDVARAVNKKAPK